MTEEQFLSDLTEEQRIATMKFDEDVSVTANAGSGKTTLLVRKYLYLQLFYPEKYNFKNIVAITFTNKAASEIRKKTRVTINELLRKESLFYKLSDNFKNLEITPEQKKILIEINKNITNLEVGTIHQFCRKLIKNFAFRIDLQPNFTSLDENEKSLLLRKLTLQTLGSSDSELSKHSSIAVSFLGFEDTISSVKNLVYKHGYLSSHENFYSKSSSEVNTIVQSNFKSLHYDNLLRIISILKENINSIEKLTDEKISQINENIEFMLSTYNESSISRLYESMSIIRNIKAGRSLTINVALSKNDSTYFQNVLTKLREFVDSEDENSPLLTNRINVGFALTKLALEVYNRYESINKSENKIDNDSTIDLTVKLLQDKVVRNIVQYDLAYLMIDEFQDTDDRQLKIADLIREGGKVNLFVVGDDKQSIYKFRNADVRVFKKLRNDLKKENQLKLRTSFRSNIYINSFINDLFSPFMDSSISEYDVEYQEIVSANNIKTADMKNVNFLFYDKVGVTPKADDNVGSSEQLIKTLHYLIIEKKVSPSDICILSNSGNDFTKFTYILENFGLDYVVLSGKGFYRRNEVKDLISFIQFIDNPNNDILCAATLKSSLFNYTDQDLYNISKQFNNEETFWTNYKEFAANSIDEYHKSIADILEDSVYLSNKLPLSNILIKIIDDSNWNYYYHDDKNQNKVFRNLYKFMGIVRSLEDKEYGGLAQTFDLLNDKFVANKESEEVGDISNSIRISTIHSAKGLEFEHVILFEYDMFSMPGGGKKNYTDENFGPNIKIPSSVIDYDDFAITESIIDKLIINNGDLASQAESLRLYYVAATRAKQSINLIVKQSNSGKQINKLKEIFGKFNHTGEFVKDTQIEVYDIETKLIEQQDVSYTIYSDYEKSSISDFNFDLNVENEEYDINKAEYIEEVPALERNINFNATKLSMFEKGEFENFEEVYIFGMPMLKNRFKNLETTDDNFESNKSTDGTDYGILFHALMENIGTILVKDQTINETNFRNTIAEVSFEYNIGADSSTSDRLRNDLQMVLNSNFIKENSNILIHSRKEYDLKMAFGDHVLKAIFDAIYMEGNTAEVWDWKTNKFSEYDTLENKAKSYELQMELYAMFVFKFNPKIEIVNSRLFFITKVENLSIDTEWIYTKQYTNNDVERIHNRIAELIGQIKNQYPNTYPVSPVPKYR